MKKVGLFAWLAVVLVLSLTVSFVTAADTAACAACPTHDGLWTAVTAADWEAGVALASGHYKLTENVSISAAITVAAGQEVCIDLAGFNITAYASTQNPYRVLENSGTLTILDSGETDGTISGGYMYAGSNLKDTFGGNIHNAAGSVFNLYGGTISGGTVHRKYHSSTMFGGGNLYSEGTVNIYGGTVKDGLCYGNLVGGISTTGKRYTYLGGGNILVSGGSLNISGGTITGGTIDNQSYGRSAPGTYQAYGGNICASSTAVNISGGTVSDGTITVNTQGVDSASGTAVEAKAYGGNIIAVSKSVLHITGGTISGGSAAATVQAYNDGTLTNKYIYPLGGSIYISSNSTMEISAGTVTGGTAYLGGTVYVGGSLEVTGGELSRGTATAGDNADLTAPYGGTLYVAGTAVMSGGTISSGIAERGGNIFAEKVFQLTGGTVTSGFASDRGGNMGTMSGSITISGGAVADGEAENYGGNIWSAGTLQLYGGNITGGSAGNGGNICMISAANAYIYGGYVDGGNGGYGIYAYDGTSASPGNLYMYGGVVDSVKTGSSGTNVINLYNGVVNSIYNTKDKQVALSELDANADGSPVVPECAHITEADGYIIWHHLDEACQSCGHTYGTESCGTCEVVHAIPAGGTHTYEITGTEGEAACIYCGLPLDGVVVASINGSYYTDLEEALQSAAHTANTVKLHKNIQAGSLQLYCKLDLNGYTLTTDLISAENTDAAVIDSAGTGGIVGKAYFHGDNPQLPVLVNGTYKLEEVTLKQIIETVSERESKLQFVIADEKADTWLDDALVNGDEYTVRITVTWNGGASSHHFRYNTDLVKVYGLDEAGNSVWGDKMFTCSITGLDEIGEHTITAELVSNRVIVSAVDVTPPSNTSVSRFESGAGYAKVNNILSWEKINAIPVYHEGMTETEIRDMIVAVHELSRSFVWVSNADLEYQALSTTNLHNLTDGAIYGGLPYMKQGTGNIYRTMDFIDPDTGVINIEMAGKQPGLFGNMCSASAWWGWARVVNSANYKYSAHATPYNGIILLGDLTYDATIPEYGSQQGTGSIIAASGAEKLYAAYALVKKADGLVYNTPGAHVVMACEDAHVEYNADGSINETASYIYLIHQTTGWKTHTNEAGDTYKATGSTYEKVTFKALYNKSYIPFTFRELQDISTIEKTEISFSHTGDTITAAELFASKVTCNYALSDVYAVFTDSRNNEVYRLAIRAAYPCVKELAITQTSPADDKDCVTIWGSLENLSADETYTVSIVAQIGTGERPVLWEGTLVTE